MRRGGESFQGLLLISAPTTYFYSPITQTKRSSGKFGVGKMGSYKKAQHKTTVVYYVVSLIKDLKQPTTTYLLSYLLAHFIYLAIHCAVSNICTNISVCLSGFWCIHLYFLRSGDGCKDGGPGNLWPQMLPRGHVESTGLLHRHGRVSTSLCQRAASYTTV